MAKRTRFRGRKRRRTRRFSRRRSKKRVKRRRRGGSRLADKRINTLVEKRMSEIAAKAVAKQHAPDYLYVRGLWENINANPTWDTFWHTDVWPDLANFETLSPAPGQFWSKEIGKCGGYTETNISGQLVNPGGMEPRDMYIHIKALEMDFRFVNENAKTVMVDMQLTRFGYDKNAAYFSQNPNVQLIPSPLYPDHPPFTSPNTLNSAFKRAYKQTDTDHPRRVWQVLARKRITLRPSRMIDDPAGAANSARLNTVIYHKLKLAKYYKKAGQKERYKILGGQQEGPLAAGLRGSLLDHRYFISIRVTERVRMVGITSVKFAASGLLARQMVFDTIASVGAGT